MSKYIFGTFMLLGSILILLTAGASDLDLIEFRELAYRLLVGMIFVVIGFRGLGGVRRASRR